MKILKKVELDDNEITMIKVALVLRGETLRSWNRKCLNNPNANYTGEIGNIITTHTVTKTQYEKFLKPLSLPFFKNFEWEEEIHPYKSILKIIEEEK